MRPKDFIQLCTKYRYARDQMGYGVAAILHIKICRNSVQSHHSTYAKKIGAKRMRNSGINIYRIYIGRYVHRKPFTHKRYELLANISISGSTCAQ